jgi:hypothetical protein
MTYLPLAAAYLGALTGWFHPDPETRAMCRAAGVVAVTYSIIHWGL